MPDDAAYGVSIHHPSRRAAMSLTDRTLSASDAIGTPGSKRPWQAPTVDELPRLVKLTLQTGGALGPGVGGGGGAGGGFGI